MTTKKIKDIPESWESGELGRDEQFVGVADESHENALQTALEMQAISIRLPKDMIRQYKMIAEFHGVGYQPLMRDVLYRFVPSALKEIVDEIAAAEKKKPKREPLVPLKMAAWNIEYRIRSPLSVGFFCLGD